ncbi:MAG: hypothetical protein PWQ08_1103 [Clostridiales bacterium]|jgi:hypothetical protein|nr:hypothetical protein [Clostridiales bacterium]
MEQLSMQQLAAKQSEVELLVYKLAGGERSAEAMKEYTGYTTRQQIPTEALPGLLRDLKNEQRIKEMLGTEKYGESRTIGGKMALYQMIFGAALRTLDPEREKAPVSWAEFRRMLAVEMEKLGKQGTYHPPFVYTGDTWGRETTECTVGRADAAPAKRQGAGQSRFARPSIEL